MNASTNTSVTKASRGFTLVEMLVVIGMIGALAGISFPVYKSIQKKVEKEQVQITFTSVERAVNNFETEYNYLPYIGTSYPSEVDWLKAENGDVTQLMTVLVAPEDAVSTAMEANFKRIRFLEAPEPKGTPGKYTSGLLVTNTTATLYRPWLDGSGNQAEYRRWRLDYSGDGIVELWPKDGSTANQSIMMFDWGEDDLWRTSDDIANYYHPNLIDITE